MADETCDCRCKNPLGECPCCADDWWYEDGE